MFPAIAIRRLVYGLNTPFTAALTDLTSKTWTAYGNAAVSSGALQFGGSGDYADSPYHTDFHFTASEDMTLRFKVKINTFASDLRVLMSTRADDGSSRNWSIFATVNGIRFQVWNTSGTVLVEKTWSSVYTFGTEFELSLERKSMTWRLYKDGSILSGTSVQTANYVAYTTSKLALGSEINAGGGSVRDLSGSIRYAQIIRGKAMGNGGSTTPLI